MIGVQWFLVVRAFTSSLRDVAADQAADENRQPLQKKTGGGYYTGKGDSSGWPTNRCRGLENYWQGGKTLPDSLGAISSQT